MARAPLIIVSGPSGSGKSTVIGRVLKESGLPLRLAVSATTRQPRERKGIHERDGVEYYFWSPERFEEHVRADAFLEWARVHNHCYGTLHSEVDDYRDRGIGVVLDIDVQGAAQIRRKYPEALSVFLCASSWEEYEKRLRARGTEDEKAIQVRLANARRELEHKGEYDAVVRNDDLSTAVAQLTELIRKRFPKTEG